MSSFVIMHSSPHEFGPSGGLAQNAIRMWLQRKGGRKPGFPGNSSAGHPMGT